MPLKVFIFTLLLTLCISVNSADPYLFSNFHLKPYTAKLNSTDKSTFVCTKKYDDNQDFEISTFPVITSDNLRIYEKRLNKTAIEITIQSTHYIGAFYLICSSKGNQSIGIRSDILIGSSPGVLTHIERCIVYENKYIDCIIQAPLMVSAIHNRYPYDFNFMEIHQSLIEDNVYNQPPELVKTDSINGTITFRWFPIKNGIFPSGLKMLINGTLRDFGSTNLTINMTPNFWIKPNFTIEVLSSTYFQVHFNHDIFLLPLFCRGNLTNDDKSKNQNQEEDFRIFRETNPTILHITHLTPNTWYKLCFYCRRNASFNTISEIQCLRKQTKQSSNIYLNWLTYLIILSTVISIIVIILYATSESDNFVKEIIRNCKIPRNRDGGHRPEEEIIMLGPVNTDPSEPINPSFGSPETTDNTT